MVPQRSARGATILVLGIFSFLGFGPLTGIPAWLMGNTALDEIDSGIADRRDREMVVVGRFLGMLASGIFIGAMIVTALVIIAARVMIHP